MNFFGINFGWLNFSKTKDQCIRRRKLIIDSFPEFRCFEYQQKVGDKNGTKIGLNAEPWVNFLGQK
jgi:hypothetical protein